MPSSAGHVLLFSDMICQSERLLDGVCPKLDREEAIRRPSKGFCMRSHVHVQRAVIIAPLGTYAHSA